MPGIVRTTLDSHIGHACPKNPYHVTAYAEGSGDVFVNGESAVRLHDETWCGDPAADCSTTVFVNGLGVHRQFDATAGHDCWVPNSAATGSEDVFANG